MTHYVVETVPCKLPLGSQPAANGCAVNSDVYDELQCDGCLRDGTRLDVKNRIEVEPATLTVMFGTGALPTDDFVDVECWVPPTRKQPPAEWPADPEPPS